MEELSTDEGIWSCTFVGECTKVCPKGVDPAGAIQRYKVAGATDWWKSLVMPYGKPKTKP
jgi:fumarate reductase iron-sulfur subunit